MKKFFHLKKTLYYALFVLLLSVTKIGWAQTAFTVDDLNYEVNDDGVSVTLVGHVNGDGAYGTLTIPESVTYNGNSYAVTIIGEEAFEDHEWLSGDLVIPNSITTIGEYAFRYCFFNSLTIGSSVSSIGIGAFSGNFLNQIVVDEGNPFFDSRNGCNAIVETETNTLVAGCKNTVIPTSIIKIGDWAFAECEGFSGSLAIPNSVTTIGEYAFGICDLKGELVIPNSVISIGEYAFSECYGLTGDLIIPNSVTELGMGAFLGCSGFDGILSISNSVTVIYDNTFNYCSSLSGTLTIPNSVVEIGDAFEGCRGFSELIFGSSVERIGSSAFENCSGFTGDLIIPNTVTWLGDGCFEYCSGFDGKLVISNSLTTIGYDAFSGCDGFIGDLIIPNSVTEIEGYAFEGCSGFDGKLVIPNSVTTIGNWAFQGCEGLSGNLVIPNSVTTIGSSAFMACGFEGSITIGNSVVSIGENAFDFNYNVDSIICLNPNPPMIEDQFFLFTQPLLIVSCGAKEKYEASDWANYFSLIEENCNSVDEDNVDEGAFVYPNPTASIVRIEAENLRHISVFNELGKQVYECSASGNKFEFDLSEHNAGGYLVRIETETGVITKRVVLTK